MEAHDVTSDVDLGEAPQEDPFAGVEADPLAESPLPDALAEAGVEQGSLGGVNPSEEEPIAEGDPGPEDEPEPPSLVPDEERPAEQDEDDAPVAEAPDLTPVPDVPADEAEVPETPVAETPPGEKSAVQAEEPAPPPTKSKRKAKKSTSKKETASKRGYVILREGAEPGVWTEAFERPNDNPDFPDEPFVLEHRNGTTALRAAYRMLADAETEPQDYVLVCVPRKLWNVKKVAGRVHKQTAISVG